MKTYVNGKNLRVVLSGAAFETACYRKMLSVPAEDAEHLTHESKVQVAGISPYRKAVDFALADKVPFRTPSGSYMHLVLK